MAAKAEAKLPEATWRHRLPAAEQVRSETGGISGPHYDVDGGLSGGLLCSATSWARSAGDGKFIGEPPLAACPGQPPLPWKSLHTLPVDAGIGVAVAAITLDDKRGTFLGQ